MENEPGSIASISPYPSPGEFADLIIQAKELEPLVDTYLLHGTPFAFREDPAIYDRLRDHVANELNVASDAVSIVGSGRIGFSLDPQKFGAPFSQKSDLDVLVVSADLFAELWLRMLRVKPRGDHILIHWLEVHELLSNLVEIPFQRVG